MKCWIAVGCLFIAAAVFAAACAPAVAPAGDVKTTAPATAVAAQKSWEQKWQTILTEAKKEGTVSIYGTWRPATRNALTPAFREKYGINLDFSPFSRGSEMAAKVEAEQRAGLYLVDFFGTGAPTLLTIMKPGGFLGPIEPYLILPEVLDGKAWFGGSLVFQDKERLGLSFSAMVVPTILYNTNMIKDGEITSHRDVLKPQYKGKITFNDPTVTGGGPALMAHLGENLWNEAQASDYLRRLVKEQDVVIERDNRAHIETVARGKYAIGLAPATPNAAEFMDLGAPVKYVPLKEDNRTTIASGGIGAAKKLAHPNAATVFLNWLLTKEAQTLFAVNQGLPSIRLDAPTSNIDPILIPKQGEKYYWETEEFVMAQDKWARLSKQIIDEALK